MKFMLESPTIEQQFQRLLDGYGLHDVETVPTPVVRQMFIAFFGYEHNWNVQLQELLDEYNRISLHPVIVSKPEVLR